MKQVISYLRIKEWLPSKVIFMIGIFLLFCFYCNVEFEEAFIKTVAYFLYISMFLAVSYVANDFSDLEIDKRAGKKKVMADMPKWMIWSSIIIMTAAGNIGVFICSHDKPLCAALIVVTYLSGLAYSTLGIRFKEHGIWGLIECSFAQRCMPLIMIPLLLKSDFILNVMLAGWMIVSFLVGIRYIIIHQVIDLENDIAAGVHTYVTKNRGNYRKLIIGLLMAEIVITCILLIPLWKNKTILTSVFVLGNAGLEYCIYVVIQKYANKDFFLTFDSVPMEAFYNTLFPVLAGVCVCSLDVRWVTVLLPLIVICCKPFLVKTNIAAVYIKSKF